MALKLTSLRSNKSQLHQASGKEIEAMITLNADTLMVIFPVKKVVSQ